MKNVWKSTSISDRFDPWIDPWRLFYTRSKNKKKKKRGKKEKKEERKKQRVRDGELIVSMVDSRAGDRICCFHRWRRFFSLPSLLPARETRSRINGDGGCGGGARVAVFRERGFESSEGKKFDKLRLCGDSLSFSLSLVSTLCKPDRFDICHENRSACRQTVCHSVARFAWKYILVDRCFPKSWADKEQ